MFKKISIFTGAHLRTCMQENRGEMLEAIKVALVFPSDLVSLLLGKQYHERESLSAYLQPMWKYFDGCHSEYHDTVEWVLNSKRIEAFIELFAHDTLAVELKFYCRTSKNPPYTMRVLFDSKGKIGGVSRGFPGRTDGRSVFEL